MAIFFCGMKKSQYFKNRVKSLFYKFVKFIFKIVGKNEQILDHMGSTKLAANYFRTTQTEERLKKGDVNGEEQANNTHFKIGEKVRETMIEISGVAPEELPTPEKGIKQIQKEKKNLQRKIVKQ